MLSHKCSDSSPAISAGKGQEDPPLDSFVQSQCQPSTKDKQGEMKQNMGTWELVMFAQR